MVYPVAACRSLPARLLVVLAAGLLLAGCESIARGMTQAMLDRSAGEEEDARLCEAEGVPFQGIEPYLARQDSLPPIGEADGSRPQVKVLYVHGIGTHSPGHSTELMHNLTHALGLDVRSPRPKRIELVDREGTDEPLGELNLFRFTDEDRRRDLVFYELTWSSINHSAKAAIAFDGSDVYRHRRASVNQAMRDFVNDVAPDPIAFAGNRGERILMSVGQSLCWVMNAAWSDLPELTRGEACVLSGGLESRVGTDDFAFITHSLGSRAIMDALQMTVRLAEEPAALADADARRLKADLSDLEVQLFMLSNQLPLLESGQEPQEITGREADFCEADSPRRQDRFFKSLQVVAFSDPNDIMSYPIPETWVETYVDSRLCTRVTNVTINIAKVRSLLGLGTVADPLTAHSGYRADERVGALMARGTGHDEVDPLVRERCTWLATDETLMQ